MKERQTEEEEGGRENLRGRWKTTDTQRESERKNTRKMNLPSSVLESRVIITALGPSIVCLGKPNPATAYFNSSLLKLLSASWLAVSEGRETEMGNGTGGKCSGRGDREGQKDVMHDRTRKDESFLWFLATN